MSGINDVRWYQNTHAGAPGTLGGVAGDILAILNGCLVNGFNLQSVASIVVASGVATVTTSASHGYTDRTVIRIAGVTGALTVLNGDWKVSVIGGTQFTFPTAAADGTAAGTLSAKQAPLGWTSDYTGTSKATYRPAVGNRFFLRVYDPAGSWAGARGFETMTSVDAGSNAFPLTTQITGDGVLWNKQYGSTTGIPWLLVGDGQIFFLLLDPSYGNGNYSTEIYGFGDMVSYVPSDAGGTMVFGRASTANGVNVGTGIYSGMSNVNMAKSGSIGTSYPFIGNYLARTYSGSQSALRFGLSGSGVASGWGVSNNIALSGTPNSADNSVVFHYPCLVSEETSGAIRGYMPGLWQPLTSGMQALTGTQKVMPDGRRLLICKGPDCVNLNSSAALGIDITGPWR
jgi:hypothetical protein